MTVVLIGVIIYLLVSDNGGQTADSTAKDGAAVSSSSHPLAMPFRGSAVTTADLDTVHLHIGWAAKAES
ncbi:hypothetical protein ACFTWF_44680 [Rhodococcus sp. NPDC056960]|uniref:hypothetical protein n=1 Tax=Rhodococcus sp. NPDC056960 TaxID=3345982 RepID=UPI00362D1523